MRILIASHHALHLGGVETYVEAIVPALAAAGHDVAVWHEQGSTAATADHVRRWIYEVDGEAIVKASEWRPDLVFMQGLRDPHVEAQVSAIAPTAAFAHSYQGTCVSGHKTHAFPSPAACTRRFGVACLGLYYPRRCGGLNPATALSMYRTQRDRLRLLRTYRRVLVASRHMAAEYARHGLASKTSVVSLPAPAGDRMRRVARVDAWRLLYLGRLEWAKGADIAVDAAARAAALLDRPIHLAIAGAGRMEPQLRHRADALSSADRRIHYEFTGTVAAEARADLLRRTDLLLVPSRWPEPFGLVGNEAGVEGVPAIAFSSGGIPEWVTDGVDGRLVAGPTDVGPFARVLVTMLGDSGALSAMADASHARALGYSLSRHVTELDAIFREIAKPAS